MWFSSGVMGYLKDFLLPLMNTGITVDKHLNVVWFSRHPYVIAGVDIMPVLQHGKLRYPQGLCLAPITCHGGLDLGPMTSSPFVFDFRFLNWIQALCSLMKLVFMCVWVDSNASFEQVGGRQRAAGHTLCSHIRLWSVRGGLYLPMSVEMDLN